jgi:predicted acyltransferase
MSNTALPVPNRRRLESLDAFRGFTILGMIFVIAVAAGQYQWETPGLPQKMRWLDSLPVSTWLHADVAFAIWERETKAALTMELEADPDFAAGADAASRTAFIAEEVQSRIAQAPERKLKNIGVTFTDLIAPWFVFIVGAVIPLGRRREGEEYYYHALRRTLMLILAGVIYIALVIKQVSIWWGVLQAIGVAYFCAALTARLPVIQQWIAVFVVGGLNLLLTETVPAWTNAFKSTLPFGSLTNPEGDWLRPLTIHCLPWLSISYGVMSMIGVLVGNAIATKDDSKVVRQCLLVGLLFTGLGYIIHKVGIATERYSLCANKVDVTTSYAFFTAGLGALTFLGFYWLIDMKKVSRWAFPLVVFGANPLLAYFLQIVMRRTFESLGVIDIFNRVTPDNKLVMNWATFIGSEQAPAQVVLDFFSKAGYMGVFWGLVWTACLWAVVLWCNRKNFYWKL